jgi:hypothetical protein
MDDSSPLWEWRASVASSLPTFAFGRIALVHTDLPFFFADISLYPGNSGGPLIENDMLGGIVSGQPSMPAEFEDAPAPVHLRLPFAKCIPGRFALQLLDAQRIKDQAFEELRADALDRKQSKWRS